MMRSFLCECRYRLGGRYQQTGQWLRARWASLFFPVGPDVHLAKGVRLEGRGIEIGNHTKLDWNTCVIGPVRIGSGVYINQLCVISQHVTIEDRVGIGYNSLIFGDSRFVSDDPGCRAGQSTWSPTVIERGAMIGARVTILPGVRVGHGCVIAAGSVVIGDCEPDAVYAGVPAKLVKRLNTAEVEEG